jgi:DNA-binding CsgD family transcriptional regulator
MGLVDRQDERHEVEALLAATRQGFSATLVFRGEAGMGKTTLLDYAMRSATDMQVAWIAGVHSESEFGFGALHRLLVPFMDRIRTLPAPQRDAIGTAFGLADGPTPDRFLVGLAALTVLSEVAVERPLLCVVDDAQWLDRQSCDVLGLVARRLFAERVAMLFACRVSPEVAFPEGVPILEGLPTRDLAGIDEHATRKLIGTIVSNPIDAAVARKIATQTEGCPLAIREVVMGLRREQLAGHEPLPDPLAIGPTLEGHFLRQVEALPSDTQRMLLLVAAEASGDSSRLWRAGKKLGADPAVLEPARRSGLLATSGEVAFRHPLIRSAVYNGASVVDRRAAHMALAEATDPMRHPAARAWHLAAGAAGPDEPTALLLAECASRARDRGHFSEAAALWARAADLTVDAAQAANSLLAGAQAHFTGGAIRASQALLARAAPDLAGPLLRAQAQRLEAEMRSFIVPSEIPQLLLETATSLEALDLRLARDTYADALAACAVSAQATTGTTPREVALSALRVRSCPDQPPTVEDLLLEAFATRFAVGYCEAVPAYRRCVEALSPRDRKRDLSRWAVFGSKAAEELWDPVGYRMILTKMERVQRERGALDALRVTVNRLADYEMWVGQFALADAYHSEAAEIAAALGEDSGRWLMLKAELLGWQGREPEALAAARVMMRDSPEEPVVGVALNSALLGLAVLNVAKGQYAAALSYARQIFDADPLTHGNHCLREVIEAGVRAGDLETAHCALERLEARGQASGTEWALGLAARSRALMADDGVAEGLFQEALGHVTVTPVMTEVARTHLLYGEWLRRQNRRTEARSQLQRAHELFAGMGAEAFAQRAARELGATGARPRRRTLDASTTLTPQELRIARLAGTGATSKEIGAEMFLSPRTIDAHLRSVFSKLGITSRRQLRDMPLP